MREQESAAPRTRARAASRNFQRAGSVRRPRYNFHFRAHRGPYSPHEPALESHACPARYRIAPLDVHAPLQVQCTIAITARVAVPPPVWIPGSFRPQSRAISSPRAESNGAGCRSAKKKVGRRALQALTVTARVYAFDLPCAAYLDATRGYFNSATVFLCPNVRRCAARSRSSPRLPRTRASRDDARTRRATTDFGRPRGELRRVDHPVGMAPFALVVRRAPARRA